MKYSCSIDIDLPRAEMVALFDNPDNLIKWQDGFVSMTHLSGVEGEAGAKSAMVYKMGKREIEMIETIERRNMPDNFTAIYEAKGVWNIVENTFLDTPTGSRWHMDTEFRCSGFMRILAFLMPGMFKKQSKKMMADFKAFAEAQPH